MGEQVFAEIFALVVNVVIAFCVVAGMAIAGCWLVDKANVSLPVNICKAVE